MKNKKADFWNDLREAEKKEIKKGIRDLDNGRKISYPDLQKTTWQKQYHSGKKPGDRHYSQHSLRIETIC